MPAPLTIAARRAMVEQLQRQEPGISARTIAARLGVGKDTIRRDIDAIEAEQRQRAPQQPPAALAPAPHVDRLVLVVDEPLRQALAVLRATQARPDTARDNEAVVRTAVLVMADTVLRVHQQAQEGGRA